jgi:hypothetical protein
MARIAFDASECDSLFIAEYARNHGFEVKSVQAYVTSRHADYASSFLGVQVCEELKSEQLQDHDTEDDSPSVVVLEVTNKTAEELEELSNEEDDFYVL